MFPARMFAPRMFAPRYFPKVGADSTGPVLVLRQDERLLRLRVTPK